MDLAALQEKINNYITVVSSWVRNVGKLYFSGTAEDVTVQMIDDNGNVVDTTLPNVAQFRKRVWDDVGGALGQFDRVFYVDAINGDDLNSGSSSSPFKTIAKAIESIPISSKVKILLAHSQEYNVDCGYRGAVGRHIINSYVEFDTNDVTMPNPIIKFTPQLDSTGAYVSLSKIAFKNSYIKFYKVDIKIDSNATGAILAWNKFIDEYSSGFLSFYYSNIDCGDVFGMMRSYVINNLDVSFYGANVIGDSSSMITITSTTSIYASLTTVIKTDGTSIGFQDITDGIVKDTNGVPRNVLSNIVF